MADRIYRVAFHLPDDHPKAEPIRFTVRAGSEAEAITEAEARHGAPDEYDEVEVTQS